MGEAHRLEAGKEGRWQLACSDTQFPRAQGSNLLRPTRQGTCWLRRSRGFPAQPPAQVTQEGARAQEALQGGLVIQTKRRTVWEVPRRPAR